ncbi:hypothetical protein QSV34_14365 [Porticoccus sp. W117]|uniref:hypothetical protein n=1 Tax=Porticoccus sp. W117 TaxID=3054777 RepID=UPI00259364BE|nr:hypothetical protein [Porticoccus sp. W117]MDM3872533.1 hypothetical protein [Porticoccus sp. W117]
MEKIGTVFSISATIFGAGFWVVYNHPSVYQDRLFWPIFFITGLISFIAMIQYMTITSVKSNLEASTTEGDDKPSLEIDEKTIKWAITQVDRTSFNEKFCNIVFCVFIANIILYGVPSLFDLDSEKTSVSSSSESSEKIHIRKNQNSEPELKASYELISVHSDSRTYITETPIDMLESIQDINSIRTVKNWTDNYKGGWIRIKGRARIGSGYVSFEGDPRGHIVIVLKDSEREKLTDYPDGVTITAEGEIQKAVEGGMYDPELWLYDGQIVDIH